MLMSKKSASPWIMVLAEILQVGKENPYIKYVSMKVLWHLPRRKGSNVVNLSPRDQFVFSRDGSIWKI